MDGRRSGMRGTLALDVVSVSTSVGWTCEGTQCAYALHEGRLWLPDQRLGTAMLGNDSMQCLSFAPCGVQKDCKGCEQRKVRSQQQDGDYSRWGRRRRKKRAGSHTHRWMAMGRGGEVGVSCKPCSRAGAVLTCVQWGLVWDVNITLVALRGHRRAGSVEKQVWLG